MAASQDVLLTNVTGNTLCNEIAVLFKIPYLGIPKKGDPYNTTEINGHLLRAHLGHCCHASSKNGAEARWMVFILDTGSPKTYLSGDAFGFLKLSEYQERYQYAHQHIMLSPPGSRFADINILGGDFCAPILMCNQYPDNDKVKVNFRHVTNEKEK